jgi:hypothetical protein
LSNVIVEFHIFCKMFLLSHNLYFHISIAHSLADFGIFKRSLETFFHFVSDLFYKQEIRGRVLTLGSIHDNSDIYF